MKTFVSRSLCISLGLARRGLADLLCRGLWLAVLAGAWAPSHATESVCAKARIEISQEVALERQAFEARMTISNNLPEAAVTNINASLRFLDAEGNAVDFTFEPEASAENVFFVRLDTEIPASIASGTSKTLKWLIIPAQGAGGTTSSGRLYFAGATLSYTAFGRTEVVEVEPDYVFVKPQPYLALDYFLPSEVFGDDPLTSLLEPVEPFSLGLRMHNTGGGTASSVSVASGQPRIVRNDAALAVSFSIKSARLNGAPAEPRMQMAVGNLSPGAAAVIDWKMEATLYGRVVGFDASYTHADSLGGGVTSLLGDVNTHKLLGMVQVDLPQRDDVPDFLAVSQEGPVKVFESDGPSAVIPASAVFETPQVSGSGTRRQVTAPEGAASEGSFVYFTLPLPPGLPASVRRVIRNDGKVLPAANAWVSKKRLSPGEYQHEVHIFDTLPSLSLSYEVEFGSSLSSNRPPVFGPLRNLIVQIGSTLDFPVRASDPDGTLPSLSAVQLPSGAVFVPGAGTGSFSWAPAVPPGDYVVTFQATDGASVVSRSILITLTDRPGSEVWKEKWFGANMQPEVVANWADPDADGLSNLLEYALDLDPTSSSIEFKPVIGKVQVDGKNYLTLTYIHRADDPRLRFETVATGDVGQDERTWTAQTTEIAEAQDDLPPGMRRTTFRDSIALEDAGFRFLRLKVTLEP